MSFTRGISGNINGRPKGSQNKGTVQLSNLIADFLEQKFEQLFKDFEELTPKERIKVLMDLLQYRIPKQQAVSNTIEFEKMTDEQIDRIIDELKATANESQGKD